MDRYQKQQRAMQEKRQARKILDFNSDWRYTDKRLDFVPAQAGLDDSEWTSVTLPHDYSIEEGFSKENSSGVSGGYVRTGVLWYRKKFTLDEAYAKKRIFLHFDGISADSEIWVNGVMVQRHPYGYTPIHVDITPHVVFGREENCIAVKADTSLQPFSRFYQGTGIYRKAELVITSHIHFDDFGVVYRWNEKEQILQTESRVRVAKFPETIWHDFGTIPNRQICKECQVYAWLYDQEGNLVAEDGGERKKVQEFTKKNDFVNRIFVPHPRLWSEKEPDLYYLRVGLYAEGKLEDDVVIPVGLRSISWSAGEGFLINGESVKFKGVCIHQDGGMFGCCVPIREWERRILLLKEMGANAIRTAHHPFPEEFYHLCDLWGMYVMDEAFDEWNKGWSRDMSEMPYGKNLYGYYQYFEQWGETDVKLMVRRDRNHPSVVMWSMGNEIPDYYYSEGVDSLRKLVKAAKEEDDTRPVTIGAEGNYRLPIHEGIMESLDLAGYNYVNIKHPDYYESIHREHGEFVFVSSETFYEPAQWDFIRKNTYAVGQFLWVGFDYLGESGCTNAIIDLSRDFSAAADADDPNYGGMGLKAREEDDRLYHGRTSGMIDITGVPRAQYYYHQSLWQEKPVIHVCSKMYPWEGSALFRLIPGADIWNFVPGEKRSVFVFTNCPRVRLFLDGELVGEARKDPGDVMPLEFTLSYSPGELRAVGYDENLEQLVSHSIATAQEPVRIEITDDSGLAGENPEWIYVEFKVTDENFVPVFNDTRELEVEVSGAELFLLGNGGLYNRESYRTNRTCFHNGRALGILRCEPGTKIIEICGRAKGLKEECFAHRIELGGQD